MQKDSKKQWSKPSKGGNNKSSSRKSPDKKKLEESVVKVTHRSEMDTCHTNDISWYNKTPLFQDSTNVPFNRIAGDPISWNLPTNIDNNFNKAVPGIMRINVVPGIGWAVDSNSAVNRCFNSMYQMIYSRTTGAMQFQQADLALFVLAMSSIMMVIGMIKRAVGVSQIYTSKNFYYPKWLLEMLQISPATVLGLQNDIRQKLNQVILNFNGLEVPNFVDVFKRQYTLASNIWADEDSVEAQLYAFCATGYYQYVEASGGTPAYLNYIPFTFGSGVQTIDTLINAANASLEVWRNSADFGLINGAIQRAYPNSELLKLDPLQEFDTTIPVTDQAMMWQINNLCGVGTRLDFGSLDVTQDVVGNTLLWMPKLFNATTNDKILQAPIRFLNAPDIAAANNKDFIMEATRLITMCKDTENVVYLENCGTEIVTDITVGQIYSAGMTKLLTTQTYPSFFLYELDKSLTHADIKPVRMSGLLTQFRNGPRMTIFSVSTALDTIADFETVVGDLQIYTTIDFDTYTGLNNAALQSMYAIQTPAREIR